MVVIFYFFVLPKQQRQMSQMYPKSIYKYSAYESESVQTLHCIDAMLGIQTKDHGIEVAVQSPRLYKSSFKNVLFDADCSFLLSFQHSWQKILPQKTRLQRDSNLDCKGRRLARWSLDHLRRPNWSTSLFSIFFQQKCNHVKCIVLRSKFCIPSSLKLPSGTIFSGRNKTFSFAFSFDFNGFSGNWQHSFGGKFNYFGRKIRIFWA